MATSYKIGDVLSDGLLTAAGGVDSGRVPTLLSADQLPYAINCSLRGGYPCTRPAFIKHALTFPDTEREDWFNTHKLQGTGTYYLNGIRYGIAVVGGRVFSVDVLNEYAVSEITPTLTRGRTITSTTAAFTMPAYGATGTASVTDSSEMTVDQIVHVNGAGFMRVTAKPTATSVTLRNLADGLVYTDNAAEGTVVVSGRAIAPTFVAPAVDSTVNLTFDDTSNLWPGDPFWIDDEVYQVVSISTDTLGVPTGVVVCKNLTDTEATIHAAGTVIVLDRNPYDLDRAYLCQAEDWLIIQDGSSAAILYDGSTGRRASQSGKLPEVPTGTFMVYINGRLWVVVNGRELAPGDIFGGPTDVINFSEILYYNEGGLFRVDEEVTGLGYYTNVDVSTGQGPLLAGSENKIWSINVPTDRSKWKSQNSPIQTVALNYGGPESHYSIIQVNSDLVYRAQDGWRTFQFSRYYEGKTWGNVPASTEMDRVLSEDELSLLKYSSAMVLDNRVLMTVSPMRTGNGIAHRGMIALDLAPVSRMAGKSAPLWEGTWTRIYPTLFMPGTFMGKQRGFVWTLNTDGENELWEIDRNRNFDEGQARIQSTIELKALNYGAIAQMKELQSFGLWVEAVEGTVDLTLEWKPDGSPCWFTWGTQQICVSALTCLDNCTNPVNYKPGYRSRIGFGRPPNTPETLDNKPAKHGYEFSFRLTWAGPLKIKRIITTAQVIAQLPFPDPRIT